MKVTPLSLTIPRMVLPGNKQVGSETSFAEMLNQALDKVNQAQIRADDLTRKFLTGEVQDVYQVTIAMEEARIAMQLAVEVRNKVVEAYQEISRMQV